MNIKAFINANITTLNEHAPNATALATKDGKILAIGGDQEISKLASAKNIIDLDNKWVIPGFIEAHAHLGGIGRSNIILNLAGTINLDQIERLVKKSASKKTRDQWILGRGWDQNDWPTKTFPDSLPLDKAAPDNPVALTRIDGHAIWVNQHAMELSGITPNTKAPKGGQIIKNASNDPSGIFIDAAMDLITKNIPKPSRQEKKSAIVLAMKEALSLGITSFHDAGAGPDTLDIYKSLAESGELPIRIYAMVDGSNEKLVEQYFKTGPSIDSGNGYLTIRTIKLFADGALGSRGAWLKEDYSDKKGSRGLALLSREKILEITKAAIQNGFQMAVHAIGDQANQVVLDAYEEAIKSNHAKSDLRPRIEHAQLIDRADVPRFASLGVIASMQPTHCTSDMPWIAKRIGEIRAREQAYIWRDLLNQGVQIAAGSDAPVENLNPIFGLYSATTRQDHQEKPKGGWHSKQVLSMKEALLSFTKGGAYAEFNEHQKGKLAPGYLADFAVLDRNIFSATKQELLGTKVLMTVVSGEIKYTR